MPAITPRRSWLCLVLAGALLAAAGCAGGPTFPKATLSSSLQALLDREGLDASVHVLEHTIALHVDHSGSMQQTDSSITIGPEFEEVARKALQTVHRVLLSTDADIRFYVLLLSDPEVPGAYLTMVRYKDDILRLNANMLATDEFFSRTVFELRYLDPNLPVNIAQYVKRDIELSDFLSWQMARRIQAQLTEEFQNDGLATVGRCGGEFRNGEFALTLNVSAAEGQPLQEATVQDVFESAAGVIEDVLSNYRFEDFESVKLILPATGRHQILPKGALRP
ncbi:MAG TPA: hypothetical protein VGB20_02525 [bacterium]